MRALAIAAAAGLAAGAMAIAAPSPARADRIEQARDRALTSAYQRELPRHEAAAGATAPQARPPARVREREIDTRARRTEDTGAVGSLMSVLLWGLLAVVVALAVFWVASERLRDRDAAELAPDEARPPSDADAAAVIERPLGDADELARRGRHAEAIHALLLRTLEELVRTAAVRVERSHTSREILARVPLRADARDALAGLIAAVELTHFGDEPATAADYERCRQQLHRFAAAFRARGLAPGALEAAAG